jgi:hypothetical protein
MQLPAILRGSGFRAFIIGFPAGFVVGVVVIGLVRILQGMIPLDPIEFAYYLGDAAYQPDVVVLSILFGAVGFIIGAGGITDTPFDPHAADAEHDHALALSDGDGSTAVAPQRSIGDMLRLSRIPEDPDAPKHTETSVKQVTGVVPGIGLVGVSAIVIFVLLLLAPIVAPTVQQVTSDDASVLDGGTGAFNFLGVNDALDAIGQDPIEEVDQMVLYITFAVVVIGFVMFAPLGVTLFIWLLNREVAEAKEAEPQPEAGNDFILIRLMGFFNQWALDVMNSIRTVVRPR